MQESKKSTSGSAYVPFIRAEQNVAEVTWRAVILGAVIAVVFGIANAYLGLKFGLTVSASIPAAVMSMAIFGILFRAKKASPLEHNIVQTIGSSGESLAAGIIFTIPAFFIWGANQQLIAQGYQHTVTPFQVFFLSLLGGGLGILLMIPLRRYLVEKEHGKLAFPEGTACAEIIMAGDEGGGKAKLVLMGIVMGASFKALYNLAKGWAESVNYEFRGLLKGGIVGIDATPALLGVGFILGIRVAAYMMAGAVLGYLVIGPLLSYLGAAMPGAILAPSTIPLADMTANELRGSYIKYIGVGAVAVGGFISLFKTMPVILTSFKEGFKQLVAKKSSSETVSRTNQDLPMSWVLGGTLLIAVAMWLFPGTELNLLGTLIAVLFGFFFVVVASRIVGLVGSSSSPVSGMTIATLLVTCLILLAFGISGVNGMITAMSVGTVVCIAVCMSGDIAQDLKTGFLLGATPRKQQLMEFVGLALPAIAMAFTIFYLNDAFGFVATDSARQPLQAPQANVMATLVAGVMNQNLPWTPVIIGGFIAVFIEMLAIPALPVAIGLYLPFSLSSPIMLGGLLAWLVGKLSANQPGLGEKRVFNGVLLASGMVAGDALVGVMVAFTIGASTSYAHYYDSHEGMLNSLTGSAGPWVALGMFALLMAAMMHFAWHGIGEKKK